MQKGVGHTDASGGDPKVRGAREGTGRETEQGVNVGKYRRANLRGGKRTSGGLELAEGGPKKEPNKREVSDQRKLGKCQRIAGSRRIPDETSKKERPTQKKPQSKYRMSQKGS